MQLYDLDRPDLKYAPWVPYTQRRLATPEGRRPVRRDRAARHRRRSTRTTRSRRASRRSSAPPRTTRRSSTLKTTVYRTSHDSALAPALIEAAENGKQSVCIVELKARFDEQRNIEWSRSLEQAGVHVVYGFPDLKIHAKTTLVIRREGDGLQRYVHIGTGNYHATTARIYEDVGLFTADPEIAADVADLFNFVTGFGRPQRVPQDPRRAVHAPQGARRAASAAVAAAAAAGEHARIRIKVNNLTDPAIVEELYQASQAGAEIDLIVRAVCALRPGVEGLSERIRVRSILGRFLEHSRLFCFEAGEQQDVPARQRRPDARGTSTTGSRSSCRSRPPHVRAEIETIFKALLADNSQAWSLARTALGAGPARRRASAGARPRRVAHAPPRARVAGPSPGAAELRRRHVAASSWGDARRRHRRRIEHGAPARRPRRHEVIHRERRCSGSARRSSATARSRRRSSRRRRDCVAEFVADARRVGVEELEVLVTSPGRQAANGDELLDRLAAAAASPRPAALGAARRGGSRSSARVGRPAARRRRLVAVCDVGGGSAQVARRHPSRRARRGCARSTSARCGSTSRRLERRSARRRGRRRARERGRPAPRRLRSAAAGDARSRSAAAPARSGCSSARSSAPRSSTRGP